jgi:hypothetical protein
MKFTVDTDSKQIQLEKQISVGDLQDLLKLLSAALKDIGEYSIAVKSPEKEYIYTPWYVPYYQQPNVMPFYNPSPIWCTAAVTNGGTQTTISMVGYINSNTEITMDNVNTFMVHADTQYQPTGL